MKKWQQFITAFVFILGLGVTILSTTDVSAINVFPGCGAGGGGGGSTAVCKAAGTDKAENMAQVITSTLLFLLGIIAVIMIIVSGIKYTTSNGDASKIKSAKDTLTYSVVGLVVAMLAWAIVTFVVGRL